MDLQSGDSFAAGALTVASGAIIEATSGTATVSFFSIAGSGGTLEANGATLDVTSSLNGTNAHAVIGNSAASVFETTGTIFNSTSLSVDFLGAAGQFYYNNSTDSSITFKVSGLNAGASATTPTNFIHLSGTSPITISGGGSGTLATGSITLSNGDILKLTGITNTGTAWVANTISDGQGGTEIFLQSVCYVAGTRILTPDGERPVETLTPGDLVLTLSGNERIARPVKWVGRRRIDLTAHPRPQTVAPIRIRKGAVADNSPHRDLLVSPDHGILADGKLICARQLANGATIRQETGWTVVEYVHVELDAHAILLAEGLPAESYLDTGNRGFFANAGAPLLLYPDLTDQADRPAREAGSCRPFVWDEASVRPIWLRLAERAIRLGYVVLVPQTTMELDLRIAIEGRVLTPVHTKDGTHVFVLPKGVTEVRVLSRAGQPTDAHPWLEDRRLLGVSVERIVLRSGSMVHEVPVDHPALSRGWWAVESEGPVPRRWTNGDAVLPLPKTTGPATLELRASNGGMIYVVAAPLRTAA
ncbi:MAG TPA: Hint domain-containing protein [Acetobacteraceae bacterium]|nr:Hint domain-containing protein [Acetobacteraceae bacterium]